MPRAAMTIVFSSILAGHGRFRRYMAGRPWRAHLGRMKSILIGEWEQQDGGLRGEARALPGAFRVQPSRQAGEIDNHAFMRAGADLFGFVLCADGELDTPTIDARHLGL